MGCEVLITQDEAWRRGTAVPLKAIADEAMADAPACGRASCSGGRAATSPMTEGRDDWWHDVCVSDDASAPASRWTPRTCSS